MSRATLTDDEARALGERWIKAGGGHAPGMRVLETEYGGTPVRLTGRDDDYWHGVAGDDCGTSWYRIPHDRMSTRVPDLRDGATRGAALDVVRERFSDPTIYIEVGFTGPDSFPNYWLRSGSGREEPYANETSEGACLVAALEAAPR